MKIGYFHSYFYKGIVLKIGVQNSLKSAFMILLSSKPLKTLISPQKNYKGIVLKIGVQNYPFFSFMILLSSKTLKTLISPQIIIRESY